MTLLFTVGGRFTICYQGHGFSNIITGCFRSLTGFKQRALHGRGRTDRRAEGTLTLLPSAEATGNGTRKGLISSYLLFWEFPGCPAVRALTARVPTLVEKLRSPALRAGGKNLLSDSGKISNLGVTGGHRARPARVRLPARRRRGRVRHRRCFTRSTASPRRSLKR